MFAYIQNNSIFCIAAEKLSEEFLQKSNTNGDLKIIEFSEKIKNPQYEVNNNDIIESPKKESPHEKRRRIFAEIVDADTLEGFDLEGVEFSDKEVGDIIVARVFDSNPHAQMALQAKILDMMITGGKNPDLMAKILEKKAKINEIRAFFGMGKL